MGYDVMYHYSVGDNPGRLKELIAFAFHDCDLILTTGGLGPTQDDLTKEVIAEAMGDVIVENEECMKALLDNYKRAGRTMTPNNLKQAYMPSRARVLPNDAGTAPGFALEKDGKLIGQNVFVKANIKADDGRDIPIMAMGPICITPELKRKGYGKLLLDYSLEKARDLGCGAVCFEGNIDFYGKSGFTFAGNFGIRYHGLPDGEDASFFLCKELLPGYLDGISGEYAPPQGYFVDEAEAEEFDRLFPHKEKLKLPGQLF